MQCKVISLYPMKYSLSDFVSLFKYASGVITSSFHATVFSLIFEKPLMSIVLDDGFDNRYVSLLEKVHASNALVGKDMNDGVFHRCSMMIYESMLFRMQNHQLNILILLKI